MSVQEPEQLDWLAQTKFFRPILNRDVISRSRLESTLEKALFQHRLTLISAPAGAGKTTLLARLYQDSPDLPMAWVALDEDDNDPIRFLVAIASALQRLNAKCGLTTFNLLNNLGGAPTEPRRILSALINDVVQNLPQHFALALDDLHLVTDPAIFVLLDYLLERMPAQMHLVVATRYDPPLSLARLRARGQLAELRLPDLRFTSQETANFLSRRLGLELTPAGLELLQSQTEGWAAGLRMLATSLDRLQSDVDRENFIRNLTWGDHYIFDYLAEEVLNHQSPEMRLFLLQTSILPQLTPELCEAVTGRENVIALLDELYRRNLFVMSVDAVRRIYRYHDLFAVFLQERLKQELPDQFVELHGRAARAEALPAPAIRHYLAAELWEEAAEAIERAGNGLFQHGMIATLRGWINNLPETLVEERPWLLFYLGMDQLMQGKLEAAASRFKKSCELFGQAGNEAGQLRSMLQLIYCYNLLGDHESALGYINKALDRQLSTLQRIQLLVAYSYQEAMRRNAEKSGKALVEAIQLLLQTQEISLLKQFAMQVNLVAVRLPGVLGALESYARKVLDQFKGQDQFLDAHALAMLGYIRLIQGQLEESERLVEEARQICPPRDEFVQLYMNLVGLEAFMYFLKGKYNELDQALAESLPRLEQVSLARPWLSFYWHLEARANWQLGRVENVRKIYNKAVAAQYERERVEAPAMRASMKALAEIGEQRYAEAEKTLQAAMKLEEELSVAALIIRARVLLAHLYLLWNRPQQAAAEFDQELLECEREGKIGLILREGALVTPLLQLCAERGSQPEIARRLLALQGQEVQSAARSLKIPQTGETLSSREFEVLKLLATGASNRDIAEHLVISELTVKSHVSSILRKLDVSSRAKAGDTARQLGIL
ncbi:MAG TPA: LuxR C-terminal-related transcriptional regulator [Chloroflexia bacterium]|nr:LuxR C-terminal-related transcriptional regulator [Chloroflexia bacterium]